MNLAVYTLKHFKMQINIKRNSSISLYLCLGFFKLLIIKCYYCYYCVNLYINFRNIKSKN